MNGFNINYNNISLSISAGNVLQVPRDMPHIVFSGRSNVGKSTLLNKIASRNKLARVSSAPGKTITINFFNADDKFYLVDLPGYGYAKRSKEQQNEWARLVDAYVTQTENIIRIIQLIDLKVGATDDDDMMLGWMRSGNIPFTVVATKADKLNKLARAENLASLADNENIGGENLIIPFSALSGEGAEAVRSHICETVYKYYSGLGNGNAEG